jgi:hypothetical protein
MAEPTYPLYHTLNKNLKGKMRTKERTTLERRLSKLKDYDTLVVILMLIAEHARVCGDIDIGGDSETLELPYGVKQRSKGTQIDLDKLPVELQEILYKFVKMLKT